MKELDLSDNNIKGSIPIELGKLSNLMYLRLSYNAFTGAVPDGLAEMKGLQLLHLQSNRITGMPTIPRLNDNIHGLSTFVADCGVPSDFDETLECDNCTMCCKYYFNVNAAIAHFDYLIPTFYRHRLKLGNADDGCYPQEETNIQKLGVESYEIFAAVLFACFIALCCMVALLLYMTARRKKIGNSLTSEMETRIKENDVYALSKIGKDSVYSYFVTDKLFGWFLALATIGIQVGILVFFMKSAEANLQNDRTAVEFTWQCPRDTDSCKNKSKLSDFGWICFGFMICAHLATDFIGDPN
ncbi:hypothetical protein QTG54_005182 [Skeletonema marinoi]|uniref:Uncharacterized protein n=1 Tax=Skeletonema marinoi TaxID=267567 RepID=A0AAD8YFJ3_9STRA|nr:hypothetical protein QTG54_005182 [Skeletonema marinoi]